MTQKPLVAITGASSGIGAATARAFSQAGHPVLMMARRTQRMHEMNLPNAVVETVDVRQRDQIAEAVANGEAAHGPVDMMFVNAGIARLADIGRQPPEEWDEMIDINTKGVMNTVHAVMKGMMETAARHDFHDELDCRSQSLSRPYSILRHEILCTCRFRITARLPVGLQCSGDCSLSGGDRN